MTSDAMIAQFLGNQERLKVTRGPVRGGGGRGKGRGKGKWPGGKTRPLVGVNEQQEVSEGLALHHEHGQAQYIPRTHFAPRGTRSPATAMSMATTI